MVREISEHLANHFFFSGLIFTVTGDSEKSPNSVHYGV